MSEEELKSMRHSLAHIMAQAIQHLWPQAKFGVGPAIDNGFYYDIYLDNGTISESDLPKIEEEMRKIVAADYPFERRDVSVEEAIVEMNDQSRIQNKKKKGDHDVSSSEE